MPTTGQNFSIHDLDQFQLRFNVTDNVAAINVTDARGWWGVGDDVDDDNPPKMQKSNAAWIGNSPVNFAGMNLGNSNIDCLSVLNNNGNYDGTINLQPTWGSDQTSVDYYHELVYSATGQANNSTVVATGTLTVYRSAFTELGFRS